MREDLKPVPWPLPPDISGLDKDVAKERLEKYLADLEYMSHENRRRFEPAFRRMKLCMMLHGIASAGNLHVIQTRHFSWCPHRYWFGDTDYGYPSARR